MFVFRMDLQCIDNAETFHNWNDRALQRKLNAVLQQEL